MSTNKLIAALAVAAFLVIGMPTIAQGDDAAVGDDLSSTYGTPTDISLAPGYRWTYTPSFPSDLMDFVTVSLLVTDNVAKLSTDGKSVIVDIPDDAASGSHYNVVIKASMSAPVKQSATQYVRFSVVSGLEVSGSQSDIILGQSIDFSPIGASDMGSVVWTVKTGTQLPDGLSLSDGRVSGTPTSIGQKTINLTATATGGEKADFEVTFTVYSAIGEDADETISSYGSNVSSRAVSEPSDISVTWSVTSGTLPAGFSLNPSTGSVSGSSSVVQSVTVTVTGTANAGPAQTVTKNITIRSEPALTFTIGDILTYKNNPNTVTSSASCSATTSAITWSVTSMAGLSVDDGTVSMHGVSTPGMTNPATLTVTTAYGQSVSVGFNVAVEDTLSITGDQTLNAIANSDTMTSAFTVTGGSQNILSVSTEATGLNQAIVDGKLKVNSAGATKDNTVTVTATSAAGQTDSVDVQVHVYNQLVFTSAPTGGAIIYAI